MKLTTTETGNYLIRFYEEIRKKAGTAIRNCDKPIGLSGYCIFIEDSNLAGKKLFLSPAWEEYCNFISDFSEKDMPLLTFLGNTGVTSISAQFGSFSEAVAKIPLKLTFDMKTDVESFMTTISKIVRIDYQEAKVIPDMISVKLIDKVYPYESIL